VESQLFFTWFLLIEKTKIPQQSQMFFFMIPFIAFSLPFAWYIFWFVLGWHVDSMMMLGHPGIPEVDDEDES
jgi:hypothetical protein